MSDFIPSEPDDATLDLLVDGELDNDERRQLLACLNDVPDGWRRCALAFLEAQSWREDLRAISREPEAAWPAPAGRGSLRGSLRVLAAMAACFLVALGLGLMVDDLFDPAASGPSPLQIAEVEVPAPVGPESVPAVPSPIGVEPQTGPAYQYVNLPVEGAGSEGRRSVAMPVVPRSAFDEGWLDRVPPALSEEFVQTLRQRGHQVEQQRKLVPYRTEDGNSVMFPVDEVELHYVGNRGYQ